MAVPLTHVNLNIPPALVQNGIISVAGIRTPPAAANPPTPVDVKNAVKLKAQVVRELVLGSAVPDAVIEAVANYESDIVLARQIALAPALGLAAAAAPPAPTGPMAGVALILNAITALNQTVTASNHSINLINLRLADIQREIAINGNIAKGGGLTIPYSEVLFLDGSRPTVPVPAVPAQGGQPAQRGRPALTLINNINTLRNLSGAETTHYLLGYGIAPIPDLGGARLDLVAQCIGCFVDV